MDNNTRKRLAQTTITKIDEKMATDRATSFLGQQYSFHDVKQAVLEGDIWTVTVSISFFDDQTIKIRIDARNGMIIDWYR